MTLPDLAAVHCGGVPNQRMGSICAAIDMIKRKPAEILRLDFSYLTFDSEGSLDRSEFAREVRLAMDTFAPYKSIGPNRKVIDAEHKFA